MKDEDTFFDYVLMYFCVFGLAASYAWALHEIFGR